MTWFGEDKKLRESLGALEEIGIGYLKLGQELSSLSGGEYQRLRLAGVLSRRGDGFSAVLLDEPTRGLGLDDVRKLKGVLSDVAKRGNLVLVVEHNLELIAAADWIIDLGPSGGDEGGRVVVSGTIGEVLACERSQTAVALARRAAM
jgi:excinuclease ABC subunit A